MPLSIFSDADDSVDILVSTIPKADNIDDHNAIIQRLPLYSFYSYTPRCRSNMHEHKFVDSISIAEFTFYIQYRRRMQLIYVEADEKKGIEQSQLTVIH